jgi:hypothetical protein
MLARFFGQTNSSTVFLLVAYLLLLCGGHFYLHMPAAGVLPTLIGEVVLPAWLVAVLSIVPLVVIYFGYQWLLYSKQRLRHQNAFIPVILAPLWLVGLHSGGVAFALHSALLLLILGQWLSAYQGQHILSTSLNTGFLLGFGSLLDVGYLWLLAFTFIVYINFGRFSLRTLIIPVVGYLTIWVNVSGIEFLVADSTLYIDAFSQHFMHNTIREPALNYHFIWVLALLLVPGITEFTVTFNRANVFKRQSFTLFVYFIVLAVIMFFVQGFSPLQLAILLPPIAILLANYVQYLRKKWMQELVLYAVLAAFVVFELGWL